MSKRCFRVVTGIPSSLAASALLFVFEYVSTACWIKSDRSGIVSRFPKWADSVVFHHVRSNPFRVAFFADNHLWSVAVAHANILAFWFVVPAIGTRRVKCNRGFFRHLGLPSLLVYLRFPFHIGRTALLFPKGRKSRRHTPRIPNIRRLLLLAQYPETALSLPLHPQ